MFYIKTKNKAIEKLRTVESRYNMLGEDAEARSIELYELRKSAAKAIDRVEEYINSLANSPKEFLNDISETILSLVEFKDAVRIEKENSVANVKGAKAAILGTAGGSAIAVLGPSAAMAYATTFGIASTGTAISSLSGAAATNAALAWIGGGALSAGGGGIAAGNTILALAGPIGWAVAGALAAGGSAFAAWKNKKAAQQANILAIEITRRTNELIVLVTQIDNLMLQTEKLMSELDTTRFKSQLPHNYNLFDLQQKQQLAALINNTRAMGNLINQRIS